MTSETPTQTPAPSPSTVPASPPRRSRRGLAALAVGLLIGIGLGGALVWYYRQFPAPAAAPPSVTAAAPEKAAQKPAEPASAAPAAAVSSTRCEEELAPLRKSFSEIPPSFAGLTNDQVKQVTEKVQALRQRLEAHIVDCAGSPRLHESQFMLGKILHLLHRVDWATFLNDKLKKDNNQKDAKNLLQQWKAQRFGRIIDLASKALPKYEKTSAERGEVVILLGDALSEAGQPNEALERYLEVLRDYPVVRSKANLYLSMAQAYLDAGRTPEGVQLMRKAMAEFPDDASFPYFLHWIWKLESAGGNLPELPKVAEEKRKLLPPRLQRPGITQMEREAAERYIFYSGFELGYARFANGEFGPAADAFREHIALADRLRKEKSPLPQDYEVYVGRSRDNLKTLETKIGRPAPEELRNVTWASDRKLAFDGKPIALLFRTYGDDRSGSFLQAIDRHWRQRNGAFELAAIAFLKGAGDDKGQMNQVLSEGQELMVECALGVDPDAQKRSLFGAFEATVGSATFIVIDRAGDYVWFQQDPRGIDEKFSIAILERIIASR